MGLKKIALQGKTLLGLPKSYADAKRKHHLGLCMIVKNEAHIIKETLYNLLQWIDCWCICDTGSTDGTQELILSFFDEHEIPGVLYQREWVSFSHNRNEALDYCRDIAEYAFVMDADDLIQGTPRLPLRRYVPPIGGSSSSSKEDKERWLEQKSQRPKYLVDKAYQFRIGPGTIYWRTQIMQLKYQWRYVGVLHEVAVCDRVKPNSHSKLEGDYLLLSRRLGSRSKDKDKYKNDARTLQREVDRRQPELRQAIAQFTKKQGSSVILESDDELQRKWCGLKMMYPKLEKLYESYERDCFYLAQSYFDAKQFENAMHWYSVRINFAGWDEEVYHSMYRQLCCARDLNMSAKDMFSKYFAAVHQRFPDRSEPILVMARKYISEANVLDLDAESTKRCLQMAATLLQKALYRTVPYELVLFVEQMCYRWEVPIEYARVCIQLERHEDAIKAIYWILMTNPFFHSYGGGDGSDAQFEAKQIEQLRGFEAACNTALSMDETRSQRLWDYLVLQHLDVMFQWRNAGRPKFHPSKPDLQQTDPYLFWKEAHLFEKMWERRFGTVQDVLERYEHHALSAEPKRRITQRELERYRALLNSKRQEIVYESQAEINSLFERRDYKQVIQTLLSRWLEFVQNRSATIATTTTTATKDKMWWIVLDLVRATLALELHLQGKTSQQLCDIHPSNAPPFPLKCIQLASHLDFQELPEAVQKQLGQIKSHIWGGGSKTSTTTTTTALVTGQQLLDWMEFLLQRFEPRCELPSLEHTRIPFDNEDLVEVARSQPPLDQLDRVWNYQWQVVSLLRYRNVFYNWKLIDSLTRRIREGDVQGDAKKLERRRRVVWTMTTCKRLDLFVPTMCSFLNSCDDIDEIDRFVVIDDNSSEQDRCVMLTLFPFIDFILKGERDKGHARSMNILRDQVLLKDGGYKYWMHMEDDFMFYKRRSYVKDAVTIMESQGAIGQVLFNRHYGESPRITVDKSAGQDLVEHLVVGPGAGEKLDFIRHLHWNLDREYGVYHAYTRLFPVIRFQNGACHCYWDGYSLRPSLVRVEMIRRCGSYQEQPSFERLYAMQAFSQGWQSAFYNDLCCEHVGRLTSERFDDSIANAYVLNQENQWTANEKK